MTRWVGQRVAYVAGSTLTRPWLTSNVDSTHRNVRSVACDTAGMTVGDSRAMVRSATAFIERLLPTDRVGVAVFPVGNQMAPSADHFAARQRVSEVVGGRANSEGFDSRFNLSSSEVIERSSASRPAVTITAPPAMS